MKKRRLSNPSLSNRDTTSASWLSFRGIVFWGDEYHFWKRQWVVYSINFPNISNLLGEGPNSLNLLTTLLIGLTPKSVTHIQIWGYYLANWPRKEIWVKHAAHLRENPQKRLTTRLHKKSLKPVNAFTETPGRLIQALRCHQRYIAYWWFSHNTWDSFWPVRLVPSLGLRR